MLTARFSGVRPLLVWLYTLAAQQRGEKIILFAGTEPAAIYRSDNVGESWSEFPSLREVPNTEHWMFPPPPHIAHVKNIAFHPTQPETLYVCIEQGALLKSTDDGQTWVENNKYQLPADQFYNDDHRVLIRPSNPQEIFMGTGDGLCYSGDGGATWERLTNGDSRIGYPDAILLDPRDENVLYIGGPKSPPRTWGASKSADATVLKTADGGRSWQQLHNGLPTPQTGNIDAMGLYHFGAQIMLLAGTATGEIYVSENEGVSWNCLAQGIPPISKGGHYRWFLTAEEKEKIEEKMRVSV